MIVWTIRGKIIRTVLCCSGVATHGALGHVPHAWSLRMHTNFGAVQTMAVLTFLSRSVSSKLDRQSHQLLWQAVAKKFSHIHFCRPNDRWLSLLDDSSPRTLEPVHHAPVPPPWSKILATPLLCCIV